MKRLKTILLSAAILLAAGGAFATRYSSTANASLQQYYLDVVSGQFLPAGTPGDDYVCLSSSSVCTYVKAGSTFVPFSAGMYLSVGLQASHKK